MRINRILLRDFRGVENLEVEFDVTGVTIVEGRNEIGKTSIADAFLLLLDELDSSGKQVIRDAQPIGRNVGPFVEADLTVGPYRLTYRKQWLRDKKTELEILEPRPEQLVGRAAHDRMLAILEEETDTALFRALRYQQGVAISQAAIGASPTLAASLDAAAGGTGLAGGAAADALLARVEAERQRYFTPVGRVTAERTHKAEVLTGLRAEVAEVERRLRELEEAAERFREVEKDLIDLRSQLAGVAGQIEENAKAVQAIQEVERRVEAVRHEHQLAEVALREATASRDARTKLIGTAAAAAAALSDLEEKIEAAAPELEAKRVDVGEAQQARDAAQTQRTAADRAAADVRQVIELLDLQLALTQLSERHERVVAADMTIAEAEKFLASCPIDEARLQEIDQAAAALAVAKARSEAEQPRVVVDALRPVRVEVNGVGHDAVPGVPIEEVVATELEVVVDDLVRITVSRPESARDADAVAVHTQQALDEVLRQSGASSLEEARGLARDRTRWETERDHARQRREENLRDLDPPTLGAKIERAEERIRALEAEGYLPGVGATSLDEARTLLHDAEEQAGRARTHETERQTALEAAESALRVLEDRSIEQRTRLDSIGPEAERARLELEEGRASVADEEAEQAAEAAKTLLVDAAAKLAAVEQELVAGDPETVRALLDNARGLQERLSRDIRDRELEIAAIGTRLEMEGQEGLSDRLAEARAQLEALERDVESENRRAATVERLHGIMIEKRGEAQQAYVGPFREKLNAYARILFGQDVDISVDHSSLGIVDRTLRGTTVPFASLSGGTREQFCVLARLACAALVSPASADGTPGGVPVIIDDALGYSDPGRLEALGAAFTAAGRDCQVIVLTCEPGRYRGIGGAKTMTLG